MRFLDRILQNDRFVRLSDLLARVVELERRVASLEDRALTPQESTWAQTVARQAPLYGEPITDRSEEEQP